MAPPDPGAASPPAAPSATRAVGARVLVVLAAIVAALALVAGYVRHAAVNSNQFANRATVALRDDSVRTLIAERVTDEVVLKNEADLLAARPIIESAVSGVVGGRAFSGLFRSAVRDVHRAVFERDERTVTLTVADVGTVLAAALQRFRPSLAREVRDAGPVEVVQRRGASLGATLPRYADAVRLLSIVLPLAALALAAGALWVSPERRRTVAELGAAAAGAGIVVVVALGVARTATLHEVHGAEARAAAGAVWDAFLGDLRTAAWILAACGAVVAAAATSLLRPLNVGEALRETAGRLVAEPVTPTLRALRALTLVAAGVVVIVARDAVVSLAVTLLGVASSTRASTRCCGSSTARASRRRSRRRSRPRRGPRPAGAAGVSSPRASPPARSSS